MRLNLAPNAGTYFKSFSDPASISDAVAASDALVFVGERGGQENQGGSTVGSCLLPYLQ